MCAFELCSFSELSEDDKKRSSSPVIDVKGVPSFRVHIDGKEEVLSAHDVAVRYIRSLFLTAKDFLSGVPIAGAVLSVPLNFTPKQMEALKVAASEAGLIVLQLVPAPGAALTAYGLTSPQGEELPKHPDGDEGQPYLPGAQLDRTVVVVDIGGTSSSVSLLQASAGLFTLLAYDVNASVGGATIDEALVNYLAKEFTKKTKVPIEPSNARAWAKLRNEAEVTKRSLSASNTAQCSIESLADGVDFSMSVNRLRIDLLSKKVWQEIEKLITAVLAKKSIQPAQVDEVIFVGGTARLQGLKDHLSTVFAESTHLTDSVDADQALARGCALHAQAIARTEEGSVERTHLAQLGLDKSENLQALKVQTTTKPVGILVPAPASLSNGVASAEEAALKRKIVDGKLFVTVVPSKTPLPARRAFTLSAPSDGGSALVSLYEGDESVRTDKVERTKDEDDDEDDLDDDEELDEEDKFVEVQTVVVKPSKVLGEAVVSSDKWSKDKKVRVEVRVDIEGKISLLVGQGKEQALSS